MMVKLEISQDDYGFIVFLPCSHRQLPKGSNRSVDTFLFLFRAGILRLITFSVNGDNRIFGDLL